MTMITPSYLGETIEYSSLHACRSTLEDPTPSGVAIDDLLDAMAILWTADRYATGAAERLPESPEVDERGLRMEIWF